MTLSQPLTCRQPETSYHHAQAQLHAGSFRQGVQHLGQAQGLRMQGHYPGQQVTGSYRSPHVRCSSGRASAKLVHQPGCCSAMQTGAGSERSIEALCMGSCCKVSASPNN